MHSTNVLRTSAAAPSATPVAVTVAGFLERLTFVSLLALIALVAVPNGTIDPWFIALFEVVVFVLTAAWILEGLLAGSWRLHNHLLLVPCIALLLLAVAQVVPWWNRQSQSLSDTPFLLSVNPFQTHFWFLRAGAIFLVGALLLRYASDRNRIRCVVYTVIAVGFSSALFGILRETLQLPLPVWGGEPGADIVGYAHFLNQNHFALLMEMTLGLAVGLIVGRGVPKIHLASCILAAAVIWSALVFCNSRGAIASMAGQFLFLAILWPISSARRFNNKAEGGTTHSSKASSRLSRAVTTIVPIVPRALLACVLVATMIVGALWVGGDSLVRRFEVSSRELNSETPSRHNSHRLAIWRSTIRMIQDNPLIGVGFGAFATAIPVYHDASGRWIPEAAHNDYLELVASGGILALIAGVWFAALFMREASRRLKESSETHDSLMRSLRLGALVGLCGVAIHSFVDFGLHVTANAVVCTALVVVATRKLKG